MAMQVPVQLLHMYGGEGAKSYCKNSLFQKKVILTAKPILEESIEELVSEKSLPKRLTMADFGCASGPNTLLPLIEITKTIDSICTKLNKKPPKLHYFLNDLPGNDYNTIFRSLIPNFHHKLGINFDNCLIGAMPGSFYGRLFPSNSLHFVHSSTSLHWSSQVPDFEVSLNKDNICLHKSSPESVRKAYLDRFDKDFTNFLSSRAVEMVTGGNMVIAFVAKSDKIPHCKYGSEIFHLIGDSLKEMVIEGMIEESTLKNFNIPHNAPSVEQVMNVIEREGSFTIKRIEEFEQHWDANIEDGNNDLSFNLVERSKYVTSWIRALIEPMLSTHFGDAIVDNLFHRFSLKVVDPLDKGMGSFNFVIVSMTKLI